MGSKPTADMQGLAGRAARPRAVFGGGRAGPSPFVSKEARSGRERKGPRHPWRKPRGSQRGSHGAEASAEASAEAGAEAQAGGHGRSVAGPLPRSFSG